MSYWDLGAVAAGAMGLLGAGITAYASRRSHKEDIERAEAEQHREERLTTQEQAMKQFANQARIWRDMMEVTRHQVKDGNGRVAALTKELDSVRARALKCETEVVPQLQVKLTETQAQLNVHANEIQEIRDSRSQESLALSRKNESLAAELEELREGRDGLALAVETLKGQMRELMEHGGEQRP